jgi:hypothetical protein
MQFSKLFLVLSLSGLGMITASAQALTPQQQEKMLQVLRQQMAQQPAKTSNPAAEPRKEEAKPKPAETHPAAQPRVSADEGSTPAQRRALEVLRKAMAEQNAAPTRPSSQPAKASSVEQMPASVPAAKIQASKPAGVSAPTAKSEPAVTRATATTKQEKLAELLEQYRADKISPEQYHRQRSTILQEP